ncbi:MAG: FecR domain-containing protein [Burkholderiaceae bacterium]|nr:FecR domain-containing protein [Burkholderiaceae bacterium]
MSRRLLRPLSCLPPALALAASWVTPLAMAEPGEAAAPQARVLFAHGPVDLRRGTAEPVPAAGAVLAPGDRVATGPGGRAQLMLADGSRVSMQAESQVRLAGAAGGLEFPSGSVRVLPAPAGTGFSLRTPRATLTVRGASFSAAYNADGSINVASEREPVEVCTAAGCVTAGDDNVRVRADSLPPTRTNARASWR